MNTNLFLIFVLGIKYIYCVSRCYSYISSKKETINQMDRLSRDLERNLSGERGAPNSLFVISLIAIIA